MRERNAQIVPGVILVVLGVALLVAQYVPGIGGEIVVPALGVGFLAVYFYTRQYGFAVPGCILTGLGVGILTEDAFGASAVLIGLGLGFIGIWVLDRLYTRFSNFWPLIPGGILIVIGLALAAPQLGPLLNVVWPVALIIVGIVLVVAALRRPRA